MISGEEVVSYSRFLSQGLMFLKEMEGLGQRMWHLNPPSRSPDPGDSAVLTLCHFVTSLPLQEECPIPCGTPVPQRNPRSTLVPLLSSIPEFCLQQWGAKKTK